ncbi:adhesion G protein-coupled receptor A1 [Engraulis encrasicolus]|uniref:adhesion G protein-coupled receptor A1 n=1 Tax=Engraulis encrasicolus TaxID=184585 RepID=UPI002FD37B20
MIKFATIPKNAGSDAVYSLSCCVLQDLKRVLSFPPYPGDYLHPVVYACTAVMLLCMLVSIFTYIVHFRVIRISGNGWHILLNFLFHTAVTFGVFAGGINQIKYPTVCQVVGVILHYSSLSTMMWLTFTARNLCRDVSTAPPAPEERETPGASHNSQRSKPTVLIFYLVSVGVPSIIVGVTAAVSLDNYGSRDDAPYCWMAWEPSLGGFYGPTGILVLIICIYFLATYVQLKRHPERKYELKAMTEEQQRLATAEMGHHHHHHLHHHHCHEHPPGIAEPGIEEAALHHHHHHHHHHHPGCSAITASMLANEHSFKAQLRATAFTLFLFLATWAFGALAVSQGHFLDMIFSCLYGAFSVTLGLFLLIQHCAKRDDIWHRWWACCPSKKPTPMDVNGEAAATPNHQNHSHGSPQTQIHCHMDSPCPGKTLLSPHLHPSSSHCKLSPLPVGGPTGNHAVVGPCCAASMHGSSAAVSPSPLLERSPRPQSLPDELPRPVLPLQSCLKDRTKSRSFNRPRPSLRDYAYHMASTSLDGSSVHSATAGSHLLDSPHSTTHLELHSSGGLGMGMGMGGMHSHHRGSQLSCHSPHPDTQLLRCRSPSPIPLLDPHLAAACHAGSVHGSMHEGLAAAGSSCHSSCLDSQLACLESLSQQQDTHVCHRHACCAKADPFGGVCCAGTDPFGVPPSASCQGDELEDLGTCGSVMYGGPSTKMAGEKDEEGTAAVAGLAHIDLPPPRAAAMACPQVTVTAMGTATLGRKGTLSRRGTLSRNGSLHEDYMFSSDATGNIRTGPWKNETTV